MKIPKTKRARRVGVELQKLVSEALRREVMARFSGVVVSVPEVRVSDDLEYASIYVSVLGADDESIVRKAMLKMLPKVRKLAASAIRIRKIPEFRFVWDDTMERADRIEQLLNKIHSSSSPTTEDDGGDS